MDFRITEDQRALREGFRAVLSRRFPRERLRAVVDGATEERAFADGATESGGGGTTTADRAASNGQPILDRRLWRELGEAGFFTLRLAEADDGVGLGLPEAVLVFEEAGRALLPGPLVATHLAAGLVAGAAEGEAVVTAIDLAEPAFGAPTPGGRDGNGHEHGCAAGRRDPGRRVQDAVLAEHLAGADAVIVVGPDGAGVRVLGADDVAAVPVRSVDPATPLHRVAGGAVTAALSASPRASGAGRTVTAAGDPTRTARTRTLEVCGDAAVLRREAALLTAAQQLGSAGRTLDMAVRYAGEREQFGQPIGAFQAVKHLCAEMLVRAEVARSAVYAAAVTGNAGDCAAAKLLADEAAVRNARDCLQVHGGMGFTWEADVHLHLKRAWVRAGQWQSAAEAEEILAAGLIDDMSERFV
ncbi:acyl-CoA dehydrogenase family protein [Streptomyces sp. KR80]|uniref:acyl-CoA dehydrogenase family protein n=1 Tax=Streptomyces sp. KR80 TaxID=3457426 RepID=UPI003FD1DB40